MMIPKPFWEYGESLRSHQFRVQDRYLEALLAHRMNRLVAYPYGVYELAWDETSLRHGQLLPTKVGAIFEDGTPVSYDSARNPSTLPVRNVRNVSADSLEVYLGVPLENSGCAYVDVELKPGEVKPFRYVLEEAKVKDPSTGKEIPDNRLRPHLSILLEGESLESHTYLPCARIVRDDAGRFDFDRTFVPPTLALRTSPHLNERLIDLRDRLERRRAVLQRALTREEAEGARHLLSLGTSHFLRLNGIIREPVFDALHTYRLLTDILGRLSAYTVQGTCEDHVFDFLRLDTTFLPLLDEIGSILDFLEAQKYKPIPLQKVEDYMWRADLKEDGIFRNTFYLRVEGADVKAIRKHVPHLSKIAPMDELPKYLQSASTGVPLLHEPRTPTALPHASGGAYFRIDATADYFQQIVKKGNLGLYIPEASISKVLLFAVEPGAV